MAELLNLRDSDKRTPLNVAAEVGSVEIALELLDRGAGVDIADYVGRTPLHQAARCGRLEMVTLLLARGAELSWRDRLNRTAIERARAGRHWDVVNLLRAAERKKNELLSAKGAPANQKIPSGKESSENKPSEKEQPACDALASREEAVDQIGSPSADLKAPSVHDRKAASIEAAKPQPQKRAEPPRYLKQRARRRARRQGANGIVM